MRILELCSNLYNHLLVIEENKVTWFKRMLWDNNWKFVCVIEHQNAINVIDDFYDVNDATFDTDGLEILTIDGVDYINKSEKWLNYNF